MSADGKDYSIPITTSQEAMVYGLNLSYSVIEDLRGLEAFINLETLDLMMNYVSELSPISGLTNLTYLSLWDNYLTDIILLANLSQLEYLDLENNIYMILVRYHGLLI